MLRHFIARNPLFKAIAITGILCAPMAATNLYGQICQNTDYVTLNTGENVQSVPSAADPYWKVVAVEQAGVTTPSNYAAFVISDTSSTFQVQGQYSHWISSSADGMIANSTGAKSMTLQRTFRTCTASDLVFDFYIARQNAILEFSVDGSSIPTMIDGAACSNNVSFYTQFQHKSFTLPAVANGSHTIRMRVSACTPSGSRTPIGVNLYGGIASASGPALIANNSAPGCSCNAPQTCSAEFTLTSSTAARNHVTLTPTTTQPNFSHGVDWGDGTPTVVAPGSGHSTHVYPASPNQTGYTVTMYSQSGPLAPDESCERSMYICMNTYRQIRECAGANTVPDYYGFVSCNSDFIYSLTTNNSLLRLTRIPPVATPLGQDTNIFYNWNVYDYQSGASYSADAGANPIFNVVIHPGHNYGVSLSQYFGNYPILQNLYCESSIYLCATSGSTYNRQANPAQHGAAADPAKDPATVFGTKVYPNPATNLLNVSFQHDGSAVYNVAVVDNLGATVYKTSVTRDKASIATLSIPMANVANGMYHVVVTNGDRKDVTSCAILH